MKCAVTGCTNCSDKQLKHSVGITFHQFPKEPEKREEWIRILNRGSVSKHTKICSKHFYKDDFYFTKGGYKYLHPGALPKLNLQKPKLSSQTIVTPETSATAQQNETTQQQVTSQQGVTTQSDVTLQIETAPPLNLKNLPEPKIIIARVYEYFQNEYETLKNLTGSSCDLNPLANYLSRTAEATGVSEQTVTAILEEREREKESGVKKKENRKRKRVKKGQKVPIDVSPIAEEPPCDTTDHHADVDHQIDEEQQMEQEDNLIETLKVEVDEEYDPAMTARITSDPLVTEMHSTVYQLFSTGNVPNVTMKTVPVHIECPSSTPAAVIPQVTAAGAPFLIIKTEPMETQQSGIQTQIQSGVAVQDPLEIVQGPSSHDKSQSSGQPSLPDQGDPH